MGSVGPPTVPCSSLHLQSFLSALWWQMPAREGHGSGQPLAGLEGPPQFLHCVGEPECEAELLLELTNKLQTAPVPSNTPLLC